MNWKNKRVLITGGAGLIGSNLLKHLVQLGADVRVADNLWRGRLSNLKVNNKYIIDLKTRFFKADLSDYDNCRKAVEGREIIFHSADVVAGIDYVFGNEVFIFHKNILINTNMLRAAAENGKCRFVYIGTTCSYPKDKQNKLNPPPLKEEDIYPANPESSYGWSKLIGEYECELVRKENLIDIGILRLHNVYGPGCDFSLERSQVIPSLIRKAVNYPSEEFIVWGSGNQRRAFVYVGDIVEALTASAEKGINRGPIQIGPDYSISIREIAEKIVSISGKKITIKYDSSKREGNIDRFADWSKAKEILDWSPKTGIDDGLGLTYKWIKSLIDKDKK
jgi:GDP-D-mannose 3',5'-epimerase